MAKRRLTKAEKEFLEARINNAYKTHAEDVWRDWGADPNKEKGAKKKTSGRTDKEKAALGIAFYLLKKKMICPKSGEARTDAKRNHKELDKRPGHPPRII